MPWGLPWMPRECSRAIPDHTSCVTSKIHPGRIINLSSSPSQPQRAPRLSGGGREETWTLESETRGKSNRCKALRSLQVRTNPLCVDITPSVCATANTIPLPPFPPSTCSNLQMASNSNFLSLGFTTTNSWAHAHHTFAMDQTAHGITKSIQRSKLQPSQRLPR